MVAYPHACCRPFRDTVSLFVLSFTATVKRDTRGEASDGVEKNQNKYLPCFSSLGSYAEDPHAY
jgi:hypothetical protein